MAKFHHREVIFTTPWVGKKPCDFLNLNAKDVSQDDLVQVNRMVWFEKRMTPN